jgi:RNA polymerase sigma factor (sigma-70 family)|tara:strand:+ start:473 stop:991 length:519 start_codon:yes stop_codon:yes gene_type:complete
MTFKDIYINHKDLVYNLSLQYIQNVEEAEEITQDVFLAVYKNLNSFKKESTIKTWLYRITINKSIDYIKAKKRDKRKSNFQSSRIDETGENFDMANFNHPGVELEQKEAVAKIFKSLNKLPGQQKTAVILLKIEGMSQAEAAQVMKTSTKAVESLFQRAKKNLRNLLSQNEG